MYLRGAVCGDGNTEREREREIERDRERGRYIERNRDTSNSARQSERVESS